MAKSKHDCPSKIHEWFDPFEKKLRLERSRSYSGDQIEKKLTHERSINYRGDSIARAVHVPKLSLESLQNTGDLVDFFTLK
jgi:hypothetical protein